LFERRSLRSSALCKDIYCRLLPAETTTVIHLLLEHRQTVLLDTDLSRSPWHSRPVFVCP
jgi:hypothetical protein